MPAYKKCTMYNVQWKQKFKEIIHSKLYILNSHMGFSLVEVLVSLGIIALLGAVAVPNLRNFSGSQEIDATAAQVVNVLRTAQSSAMSRIRCPNGDTSETYLVRLTSDNYSLIARCDLSGDQIVSTNPYSPQATDNKTAFSGSIDVCFGQTTDVIFSKGRVTYSCFGTNIAQSGDVTLTLNNASKSLSKNVKIEAGGVIKVE